MLFLWGVNCFKRLDCTHNYRMLNSNQSTVSSLLNLYYKNPAPALVISVYDGIPLSVCNYADRECGFLELTVSWSDCALMGLWTALKLNCSFAGVIITLFGCNNITTLYDQFSVYVDEMCLKYDFTSLSWERPVEWSHYRLGQVMALLSTITD